MGLRPTGVREINEPYKATGRFEGERAREALVDLPEPQVLKDA